jgi:type I pantothenate kinase
MTVEALARAVSAFQPRAGTFVIGLTGSVAAGKSVLAAALAPLLGAEVVNTDGFLLPTAVLAEHNLLHRKGFPESYDLAALTAALAGVRAGPAAFPAYSHITFDPIPGRTLDRPAALLIEGLALGLSRPPSADGIDCLIYLDAAEADLEAWFVARFVAFWEEAEHDPASFYRRFRHLDLAGVTGVARQVWAGINLPNLREHIAPVRDYADLVVVKGADHAILDVHRPANCPDVAP